MFRRTHLAWYNLTADPRRLAIAVGGVGFAVLLMFIELGFLNALLDSTVQVLRLIRGELVMVSSTKYALPACERFDRRRLYQARGVRGVGAVEPVYIETFAAILRRQDQQGGDRRGYPIRAFGVRVEDPALELPEIAAYADQLRQPGAVLVDSASRPQYAMPRGGAQMNRFQAELSGRRVRVVGTFHLGVDFANDGNLLMSHSNFSDFFPHRIPGADPLSVVDLGVIRVAAGADVAQVQAELARRLPDDVAVFTKAEFIEREKDFWRRSTPVGYIFMVGVAVGFLVGVIVCYQIIYADITDHLPEFATLKAMGYPDRYFVGLVLAQAAYLSLMGYLPGCVCSLMGYRLLASFTGLTMRMGWGAAAVVLAATVAMCSLSGLLAVRRLASADPADLF